MHFRFLQGSSQLVRISLLIACFSCPPLWAAADKNTSQAAKQPKASQDASSTRKAERLYYDEAQKALNKKQLARYQQILPNLKHYPLLPYLEYQELSDRLMAMPQSEVERFFSRYPDSFLAERLRHRWLRTLASKGLWSEYRKFYDSELSDPELACFNLQARLATGDNTALNEIEPLWNIKKPQSKSCDTLFAQWKQAGLLTPELLWSRLIKAVDADEVELANKLAQEMAPAQQVFASQYQRVGKTPQLIFQTELFNTKVAETRAAIALGLQRYAQTDSLAALGLWRNYQKQGTFNEDEVIGINYVLAQQLLRQNNERLAEDLVAATPNLSHVDLLEALIRESLRRQDWGKSNRWIRRLPADLQKSERWSYWQARTMEELHIKEIAGQKSSDIYARVANERSFYGFLSADKLGVDYSLGDRPLALSQEFIKKVELSPGIQRAREFYLVGDLNASSREWLHTTRHFSAEEIVAAGRLADHWGWYRLAIQTMGDAQLWDELQVRFPLVYPENIRNAARQTSVNEHMIFAITRQESAFKSDAKSIAGALGLMQLLPSTAKETARKNGMTFKEQDLLQPERNITLGSQYLDQLLGSFSGNRILAAAAYNAGPGRVRKWLNKEDAEKLPYDVWIETIPFKETRTYVQNILSYSVIYGYRMGKKQSFVTQAEIAQQL
ncbi:MAG TPA: transglycosylase SLT domain-containing protein [Cellvibrio sp.]|nr:transglycosylase SLT domain-containing protein [Cellvibrio sp.]